MNSSCFTQRVSPDRGPAAAERYGQEEQKTALLQDTQLQVGLDANGYCPNLGRNVENNRCERMRSGGQAVAALCIGCLTMECGGVLFAPGILLGTVP